MFAMSDPLPALIQALCDPGAYAHPVETVQVIQTHISWVLLAGEFAYKIKKPVRLVFLDFSTLDLRHRCCLAELELNSRFAPAIYVGVVGIGAGPAGWLMESSAEPIEYAVKMRRFDEGCRLDHVCQRDALKPAHLSDLAVSLSGLYARAPIANPVTGLGGLSDITRQALDNFADPMRLLTTPDLQTRLQRVREWTLAALETHAPMMAQRQRLGRVRECHGDLHMANLVLINGQVQAFDCIEFAEDLRWIDVLSDVAFLYVDLLACERPGLANWWLSEVLSASDDHAGLALLRFYAVYRAMVRLKVACILSQQTGVIEPQVQTYLHLAENLMRPAPVHLIITHGLSGSGKTVASGAWLQQPTQGMRLRLRADVQRKRLFGLDALADSQSAPGEGIYSAQASQKTYAHLLELARDAIQAGCSVLVDASFLKRADRDAFADLAASTGADFQILATEASITTLRQRIQARLASGHDASEANLAVLEQQLKAIEPLTKQEQSKVLTQIVH